MKARKIIAPIAILAGVGIIVGVIMALSKMATAASYADVEPLGYKTLRNTISITGNVESTDSTKVFSKLNYIVDKVDVEVGDVVTKGQVLCVLNTDDLQTQILQQQSAIESSNVNTNYVVSDAEKRYNEALANSKSGTNQQIVASEQAIERAKFALDRAKTDLQNFLDGKIDTETQLNSAELAVENAKLALQSAESNLDYRQKSYDKALKEQKDEDYSSLLQLKNAVENAEEYIKPDYMIPKSYDSTVASSSPDGSIVSPSPNIPARRPNAKEKENFQKAYDKAVEMYENAKRDVDDGHVLKIDNAEEMLHNAKQSVENAKIGLNNAENALSGAKKGADSTNKNREDTIASLQSAITNAQTSYDDAVTNLELMTRDVDSNLSTLKAAADRERTLSTVNNAQVIQLENLKSKLDDAVIIAPCDGVITYVGAVEGSIAQGQMFMIEDIENLKITASVSEYDIASIKLDMPVIVKSEAIGKDEFEGVISKIAPTATKDAMGSGSGNFDIEISVTSKDTPLMIGMTAKLNVIVEEKANVLAVMYDSVSTDKSGNDIIYVAAKDGAAWTAKATQVTVGMETDFECEVSGTDIKEGILVLVNTETIYDGAPILVEE